ncbi:MAG: ATP-grasp domain-containing protein [Acidobacteriaceae bacterium]
MSEPAATPEAGRPSAILCISTFEKGQAFLRECAREGCQVSLLTEERLAKADWPFDTLAGFHTMPGGMRIEQIIHTVTHLSRNRHFDRIVALDEFDMETVAALREHMQLPGMGTSATNLFRDKLAMRTGAARAGVRVPEFIGVFNYDDLRAWMANVPPPWVLKPRAQASAVGIRKLHEPEELWRALNELGDQQSYYLLERFVPGKVFHVDGIVSRGEVLLAAAHAYGQPPMQLTHEGGVFTTRQLERETPLAKSLVKMHSEVVDALRLESGITHTEFIQAHADGALYFLEAAARVGGAYIAEVIQHSLGVNLWAEWARLEIAGMRGQRYTLPPLASDYAGSVLCLAQQADPDTSQYTAPEIVYRIRKRHHAGLIVRSADPARVQSLLDEYSQRFVADYLAVLPAPDRPTA